MSRLKSPDLPIDRYSAPQAAAGAALLVLGAVFWRQPWTAVPVMMIGTVLLSTFLLRHRQAETLARRLCGDEGAPSLLTALKGIEAQMQGVQHRLGALHPVTGLPTRERLHQEITADIGAGRQPHLLAAIRLADFDRLASFDRAAANHALCVFAERLRSAVKPVHIIAQTDRDCFSIWFRTGGDLDAALAELRAVIYVAAQEFAAGNRVLTPSIEAGSVRYPEDGADGAQLLLSVSAALAPASGALEDLAAYAPASQAAARERFVLEQDLAQAIAQDQLALAFQPVVDLACSRLIGAEALLRWTHPTLGAIAPSRFIPIMESIGLSERLGLWVLNAACREARRWRDEGLTELKVAVNLSARQLLDPELCTKVDRTLRRHGLGDGVLELELTETAAMTDASRTLQLFGELRKMGVSLAIDDFGTGYSSLSYLKNLPFDKLKIDREFVTGLDGRRDSQAICKALIELSRGLGLQVLAEGAETSAEVSTLRALGCDLFQGYFFSKPVPGDDFLCLALDPSWTKRLHAFSPPPLALDAA